jgi:hypothetical protein
MVLLTWTIHKPAGVEGGNLHEPTTRDVEEKLLELGNGDGSLTIDMSADGGTEKSLQVLAATGQFVVTLGYETDDDYEVRSFNGPKENLRMIEIGGNLHRSDSVCTDHDLISSIVLGFLRTGDAPLELLS